MLCESVDDFAARIGIGTEGREFMRTLPDDVQEKVILGFDPTGTKDGNVLGRLQGFANSIVNRSKQVAGWQHTQRAPIGAGVGGLVAAAPWGGSSGGGGGYGGGGCRGGSVYGGGGGGGGYSGGGGGAGSAQEYCQKGGFDELATEFLCGLPQDVQLSVMKAFDPSRSKDGNVFGRLLGFSRPIWIAKLGLDGPAKQETLAMMRTMPDEVQARILCQFDASGTKDGNVVGRLQGFARGVAYRMGASVAPVRQSSIPAAAAAPVGGGGAWGGYSGPPSSSRQPRGAAAVQAANWSGALLLAFAQRLRLDQGALDFIASLPEEVQAIVVGSFDPSGTKDGNVWGRLFGFIRSVWMQRIRLDKPCVELLKGLPEEVQQVIIAKFDPSRSNDGNVYARLESFARSIMAKTPQPASGRPDPGLAAAGLGADPGHSVEDFLRKWNLSHETGDFIMQLPESVRIAVVHSFKATGTKDGNIWGRLFGFLRSIWSQKLGLKMEVFNVFRGLPEEAQKSIMVSYDDHEAEIVQLKIEELGLEVAAGVQQLSLPAGIGQDAFQAMAQHGVDSGSKLDHFLVRCGLPPGREVEELLESLDPEVRDIVLAEFDPGGTLDGNVMNRLVGFAGAVERKRAQRRGASGPTGSAVRAVGGGKGLSGVTAKIADFLGRCGMAPDGEIEAFIEGLDAEVREIVFSSFDPGGTKDGNVFGRLRGFATSVERKCMSRRHAGGKGGYGASGGGGGGKGGGGGAGWSTRSRPY